MKRVALEPAFLLSLRPYRETGALLEVFTANHGRVGLVARGVQSPKSKLRGLLQPFQRLLLSWVERGELGTLIGAEAGGPPAALSGESVFSGWYLNELLLRLLARHDMHGVLFQEYFSTLASLSSPAGPAALRIFEKHLLQELGYGLQLPETLQADAWYEYDAQSGVSPAPVHSPQDFRGASLIALALEEFDTQESLRDAKRLLREALAAHLGGRALETPKLLRALRATAAGVNEKNLRSPALALGAAAGVIEKELLPPALAPGAASGVRCEA